VLFQLHTNSSQFVRVNQILLNILTGKAGLLHNAPFVGPPVANVLRQFEGAVNVSRSSPPNVNTITLTRQ
jgi:hypothetical protein